LSNLYVQFNTLLRAMAKCTVHIVKQKDVVTYVSPVEVFVNEIKIFNHKNCPWLLVHSECLDRLIYKGSNCSAVKIELAVFKSTNTLLCGSEW